MSIRTLRLSGLLSFAPESRSLDLRNLNVLIGPNGSGKSNLIEALELLAAMPRDLSAAIRYGGGRMIDDFRDAETERIWRGERLRRLPSDIQRTARRKLRMLNNAETLADLRVLAANRLEALKGDREGQCSIRVNDQWRIWN